jgi:hypothetical protein
MKISEFRHIFRIMIWTSTLVLLNSCDPGLNGDLKVFNESDSPLTVMTSEFGSTDTAFITVNPNSNEVIMVLGGLGNQKTFDCCPCEFQGISIKTARGNIKKDPSNKDNWMIPNKSKQKKFGGEDIRCEFHVTKADI